MAAGDTLQGKRLAGRPEGLPEPGDYYPVTRDGEQVWMACTPSGPEPQKGRCAHSPVLGRAVGHKRT